MDDEGRTKKEKAALGILAGWSCSNCLNKDIWTVSSYTVIKCKKNLKPSPIYGWCKQFILEQ